jgi:hypothetical protein
VSASEKAGPSESVEDTPTESVAEVQQEPTHEESASTAAAPDAETAARELAEEDAKKTEAPQDPSPTPVASRAPAPVVSEPEKPKEPPKQMTWASRAAAAAGPQRAAVPLPKTATPPAPTQPRAQPVSVAAAAAATVEVPAPASRPANKENVNEWQTAGADSKRQSRPLSISGPPPEREGTLGYIRNVTDKINAEDLRAALAAYGELKYFDVNRQKVCTVSKDLHSLPGSLSGHDVLTDSHQTCAFVEYVTPAGYQAAVTANPHTVNGEEINVEPRRPKANAYGGSNYANNRGGLPGGRGRGGFAGDRGNREASSGGSQRGGYGSMGRPARGGLASRGARGAAQAGNT